MTKKNIFFMCFKCSATIRRSKVLQEDGGVLGQSSYQVPVSHCLGFVDLEPYPIKNSS